MIVGIIASTFQYKDLLRRLINTATLNTQSAYLVHELVVYN